MNDLKINLTLSVAEVNNILAGLQELPAKICNPLSQKIQQQAQPQLLEYQKNTDEVSVQ